MSYKFLLFLFFIPYSSAHAKDACSTVDYSHDLGPIRDQGDKDWCYAFTAADMMTQKLRLADPIKFANEQISAADVAYQYYRNPINASFVPDLDADYTPEQLVQREQEKLRIRDTGIKKNATFDTFNSGYIDLAIHAYKNNAVGVCTEADLPSTKGVTGDLVRAVNDKFSKLLRVCQGKPTNEEALAALRNRCWDEAIQSECHRQKIGIQKLVHSADGIDGSSNPDGSFTFFTQKNGVRTESTAEVQQTLREAVDEGLNLGRIVGIDISPAFLMNDKAKANLLKQHARHSLSIVSRTEVNGQCYYKLRNSWGPTCERYNAKFKDRCVGGQIWVTPQELSPNMYRAQYLE
jgi:hypothetical protein